MCGRTVLAGDPKQECFSECSYFSNLWCSVDESEGEVARVHLVNNYRSCASIVEKLNLFSKRYFPNIGGKEKQVSKVGECDGYRRGEDCIKVYHCNNNLEIGRTIARIFPPKTCTLYLLSQSTHTATTRLSSASIRNYPETNMMESGEC